jgi:sec-independent protein translocase protein TatC
MGNVNWFIGHLAHLKKMLFTFGIGYLIISAPIIYYAKEWFELCSNFTLPDANIQLIATDITSAFMVPLKWALLSGFLLALPILFIQIWHFISPGLYAHEKKWAKPVFIFGLILFYAGASFALSIVSPMAIKFFTSVAPNNLLMMTDIHAYYDFVINLMLAFGISFEIPIIIFLCVHLGWVSHDFLAKKRPYIIVGAFIIGMLLTPPDVISQIMLAIPLWLLFESGLWIAKLNNKI